PGSAGCRDAQNERDGRLRPHVRHGSEPARDLCHRVRFRCTFTQSERREGFGRSAEALYSKGARMQSSGGLGSRLDAVKIQLMNTATAQCQTTDEVLRDSEQRYRMLFEENPHPTWVFDVETLRILDVNGAAIRNYGYSREEFLTLTIEDIRPPEDVPA